MVHRLGNRVAAISRPINRPVPMVVFVAMVFGLAVIKPATAQLINVSSPFVSTTDRYYENFGLGFGFRFPAANSGGSRVVGLGPHGQLFPNVGFRQNLGGIPPFGGFNPAAGAQFGFQTVGRRGGGFGLTFNMAQGSSRTNVTTAPSLTMMNGGSGFISNGGFRPFVTSNLPVVGDWYSRPVPMIDNGVTRAINSGQLSIARGEQRTSASRPTSYSPANHPRSTAVQGEQSVAAIKAQRKIRLAAEREAVSRMLLEGDRLARAGERVQARMTYRKALGLTQEDDLIQKIKAKLRAR